MSDNKYADSERFIFCRNKYTDRMCLTDTLNEFSPVTLNDRLSEILSQILWEHTQFVNEKKYGLVKLNALTEFVRENSDIDKDILIACINNGLEDLE